MLEGENIGKFSKSQLLMKLLPTKILPIKYAPVPIFSCQHGKVVEELYIHHKVQQEKISWLLLTLHNMVPP